MVRSDTNDYCPNAHPHDSTVTHVLNAQQSHAFGKHFKQSSCTVASEVTLPQSSAEFIKGHVILCVNFAIM